MCAKANSDRTAESRRADARRLMDGLHGQAPSLDIAQDHLAERLRDRAAEMLHVIAERVQCHPRSVPAEPQVDHLLVRVRLRRSLV